MNSESDICTVRRDLHVLHPWYTWDLRLVGNLADDLETLRIDGVNLASGIANGQEAATW